MRRAIRVNVSIFMVAAALLTTGCLPLMMAERVQYHEDVRKGLAPPPEVLKVCTSESTVRGSSGAWVYDQELEHTCLARAGWVKSGLNALGQATWTRQEATR